MISVQFWQFVQAGWFEEKMLIQNFPNQKIGPSNVLSRYPNVIAQEFLIRLERIFQIGRVNRPVDFEVGPVLDIITLLGESLTTIAYLLGDHIASDPLNFSVAHEIVLPRDMTHNRPTLTHLQIAIEEIGQVREIHAFVNRYGNEQWTLAQISLLTSRPD